MSLALAVDHRTSESRHPSGFAPAITGGVARQRQEANVAVFALVAAVAGLALAVVIYICSVCNARSFSACLRAVQRFWIGGC
ncbi:hypothetical protein [Galbitalea soli]|uniref:Uncharacterized protein n=1 Tax=Galbitalea soli TaxID=1268042 RepID=A0A7C9PMJ1_9MICO|nr:hypothetical protein [Galbitalea soli]NEM90866.1 hypothetical protein [Galbitalea soli]NYJ31586.1 hypothetical protein [Galbitalea soli]